jgi:hypothetical protein
MEHELSADTAAHAAQQHQVEALDLQTIPDLRCVRRRLRTTQSWVVAGTRQRDYRGDVWRLCEPRS